MTSGATVLVIEDDPDLRRALLLLIARAELEGIAASDGQSGLRMFFERRPDCVVLDVGLPGLDGWTVLERLRELSDVPVLMLTARHLEADKVRGLRAGADDYMTKPFGADELIARLHALLRRIRSDEGDLPSGSYSDAVLNVHTASRRVEVGGRPVELTETEFRALVALVRHSPNVLSHGQLLEFAWGDPFAVGPDRVKYTIHRLRKKLDSGRPTGLIETVRGVGYRYVRPARP